VQAYQEIESRLVSETVFSQYMYKTLPSCNHLWAFKKQFCCQMALSGESRCKRHSLTTLIKAVLLQGRVHVQMTLLPNFEHSRYQLHYSRLSRANHCCTAAGLLCHMLLVGGRMPYKILFARNSGKTFQVDFMPSYDPKGILERTEPVPFRLTRNLHTFFTPFGVEGVFVSAMAAAAQASTQLLATTIAGSYLSWKL
jgi:transformation/transcription domain-associated protein